MCNNTVLQQKIRKHTDNGDLIAQFLADTIRGEYPDAKYHHRLEAAKLLDRYGSPDDTLRHSREGGNPEVQGEGHSQFWGLIPTPEELAAAKHEEDEHSPLSPRERVRVRGEENPHHPENPVSYADILNYEIAHLIRTETAEGHTIAEFLSHVMTRRDRPFTPKKLRIRQTDRMAAAREILRRGHGHFGRKPKLTVYADDTDEANDYDTLHTDLARRMREYNQHGTDATRFLLDVMSDASLDPEEAYTWHHKMSAAQELIRRGWDTNYDNITPEMLQAYWQDQQSTRLSIGQKKHLAGLSAFVDEYDQYDNTDYEAIAKDMREAESSETFALSRHSREGGNPEGQGLAEENPLSPQFTRHSRENGNPEGLGAAAQKPLSPHINSSFPRRRESSAGIKSLPPRRGKVRMGVKSPDSSPSENPAERESGKQSPLSPQITRHSHASRNQAEQDAEAESPFSPSRASIPAPTPTNDESDFIDNIDDIDYYIEPLTPEEEAIFNYNSLIESGEFKEGEISIVPPSEAARRDYALALKQIREAAARDGVPLLPNPLSGKLRAPTIRSP